jgi:hypothetical protein
MRLVSHSGLMATTLATGLAAAMLAAVPAGAAGQLDYSKNSVSGEYQAPAGLLRVHHLDYSRNSVSGEDNAATPSSEAPTQVGGSSTPSIDRHFPYAREPANHGAASIRSAPPVRVVDTGRSGGFHWGDAGIGAGAVIVLTLVVGIVGTLLLGRRTGSHLAR